MIFYAGNSGRSLLPVPASESLREEYVNKGESRRDKSHSGRITSLVILRRLFGDANDRCHLKRDKRLIACHANHEVQTLFRVKERFAKSRKCRPSGIPGPIEMRVPLLQPRRTSFWLILSTMLVLTGSNPRSLHGEPLPPQPVHEVPPQPSPQRGELLFSGRIHFQNGGPACSACHSIAGLPFPNGGTLGPNLTHTYEKLGSEGMNSALETLFFPTMVPLYDPHPLTVTEQADLKAFLKQASSEPPSRDITPLAGVIALFGFAVLILITWAVWRNRLPNVRRTLVARAMSKGEIPS